MAAEVRIIGLHGLPDIKPGADLVAVILEAAQSQGVTLTDDDVLVVTQKIVSKAEDRLVDLRMVTPSAFARQVAKAQEKDPRVLEVVLRETKRVVKMDQRTLIAETHHGFVCAHAGVDESNVAGEDTVALLPVDADASARRLREGIRVKTGVELAVIIADTFGRPWREGLVNVAIGVAGIEPLKDYRGLPDTEGRVLKVTTLAIADELASAAELVMGKLDKVPVAVIKGYAYTRGAGSATQLVRKPEKDLFR
ncbi:MAG TPA: coenzyme F420-0:L-glutamate ligase [Alphaproteobacteria bacterium]|nr:coenzyme F420-0:L-glutamate ligase [Alphaproteobacteria bacterium]